MDSGSPAVRMTVNWVNEMLEDFSCALDDSNEDELLNKCKPLRHFHFRNVSFE